MEAWIHRIPCTACSALVYVGQTDKYVIGCNMTSLRYGRIFCLEFQKIDGTEYLMGSTELAIFWKLLNVEAWNLEGVYKIENK